MKKMITMLMFLPTLSFAGAYFRLIDLTHIHEVAGALIDPITLGNTSGVTAVALVTHSVRDGCILPSVVCEDWSPLMAGLSIRAGQVQLSVGPAVNLTPLAKLGLLSLVNQITKEDSLLGLKSVLGSQPISGPDLSISFGPALAVSPVDHGVIIPVNQWKGKPRLFAGAALSF